MLQLLLIGAEEGLFAMDLDTRDQVSEIDGIGSVFQMLLIEEISVVLMITGKAINIIVKFMFYLFLWTQCYMGVPESTKVLLHSSTLCFDM